VSQVERRQNRGFLVIGVAQDSGMRAVLGRGPSLVHEFTSIFLMAQGWSAPALLSSLVSQLPLPFSRPVLDFPSVCTFHLTSNRNSTDRGISILPSCCFMLSKRTHSQSGCSVRSCSVLRKHERLCSMWDAGFFCSTHIGHAWAKQGKCQSGYSVAAVTFSQDRGLQSSALC